MKTFTLRIDCENAAFEDDNEIPRILREMADKIEGGLDLSHFRTVFDVNGNDVGRVRLGEK